MTAPDHTPAPFKNHLHQRGHPYMHSGCPDLVSRRLRHNTPCPLSLRRSPIENGLRRRDRSLVDAASGHQGPDDPRQFVRQCHAHQHAWLARQQPTEPSALLCHGWKSYARIWVTRFDQAARFLASMTPSVNLTPSITIGNWLAPFRRRHPFAAACTSL